MKKQTIKLMTTMTGSEELTAHFLAFIRRLTEDGWSIDTTVSEGGGCWEIKGERDFAVICHLPFSECPEVGYKGY